jgi:hypothetical protein
MFLHPEETGSENSQSLFKTTWQALLVMWRRFRGQRKARMLTTRRKAKRDVAYCLPSSRLAKAFRSRRSKSF